MTKFFVLAPCDQIDLPDNALPPFLGGSASQLPAHQGGRPNQGLPGSGHPDNSLPGPQRPDRPDNSLPGQPDRGERPGYKPDNSLPGLERPVDPGYGVDAQPGQPLPMPSPSRMFTDEEKREILRLAEKKFTSTDLSPMRCIVQAARWVLVTRKSDSSRPAYGGAHPDQSLPGQPATKPVPPTQPPVPTQPIQPTPLPTPPNPDNTLPPAPPPTPDQSLPPTAAPKTY